MNGEAKMFLMGLGALLVFGGVLYMARATIWRGSLSRPARDTLEPPPRGVGFLGLLGVPLAWFPRLLRAKPAEPAALGC